MRSAASGLGRACSPRRHSSMVRVPWVMLQWWHRLITTRGTRCPSRVASSASRAGGGWWPAVWGLLSPNAVPQVAQLTHQPAARAGLGSPTVRSVTFECGAANRVGPSVEEPHPLLERISYGRTHGATGVSIRRAAPVGTTYVTTSSTGTVVLSLRAMPGPSQLGERHFSQPTLAPPMPAWVSRGAIGAGPRV